MGVATSNTSGRNIAMSNTSGRNIAANKTTNNQKTNRPQQTEGFLIPQDPITTQTNFFNSQFLEYGATQPNIFLIPASNLSNVALCNANTTNQVLNDSIFGTLKSIYGTTNTVAITPEDYSQMKINRATYSNYDPSKDPVQSLASKKLTNTESKKQLTSPLSRIFDFVKPLDYVPKEIIDGQTFCEKFNSITNNVEQYYANNYNRNSNYRCGFVYNPNYTNPATGITGPVFRGHYGYNSTNPDGSYAGGIPQTIYNPYLINAPGSVFYWEMNDTRVGNTPIMGARTAFKQYYCQMKVPSCSNVNAYSNECVWATGLGRAVPTINTNGYYVESSGTSGNPNSHYRTTYPQYPVEYSDILSNSFDCPITTAGGGTVSNAPQTFPRNCYDTNSNLLSGDYILNTGARQGRSCAQSLLSNAGCSNNGAIIAALLSGSPTSFSNTDSFMRYNQVYPNLGNLFTSNASVSNAQRDINELGSNARKTEYTSVNYAARELCLTPNVYQTFDFCTEYGPSTPAPFLLNCVQQEFRVQGGQKTGLMYPQINSDANMTYYNGLGTWGNVKTAISQLLSNTKSSDLNTQAIAFNNFYGINAQQFTKQFIPSVPGLEVFWFSIQNAAVGVYTPSVFLGRRIQLDLTLNMINLPNSGIQFISFFNLKTVNSNNTSVQYSFSNTDGLQILENENIGTTSETTGKYMAAWTNSVTPRLNTNGSNCWPVSAAKPNYFTVSWYRSGSSGTFNQNFFKTCDATPSNVNAGGPTMNMSQEEDAPMISFEVVPDPDANQISFFSSEKIPAYVFGDPRLWKVMPISDIASATSINTTEKFGFTNKYLGGSSNAGLQALKSDYSYIYGACTFTSGSVRKTNIVIQNQSWRTITMLFRTGSFAEFTLVNQMNYLLQYGELSLGITYTGSANSPVYKFTVVYGTGTNSVRNINNILPNTNYYIIIMQDFDTNSQNTVTTNLKVCCCDVTSLKTTNSDGTPNTSSTPNIPFNGGTTLRYNNVVISGIWRQPVANYKLSIGGTNSLSAAQTVGMDVGWVRIFDYVFESADLQNDLGNKWLRNWWNMI